MIKFVVLLGVLAVTIQTTQSQTLYERWLQDIKAAADKAQPKPVQPRQSFVFPTKKLNSVNRPKPMAALVSVVKPVGRKSQEKCMEYAKLSVTTHKASGFSLDSDEDEQNSAFDINISKCDISSGFIVGGIVAKEKEFPHMAAMGFRSPNGQTEFFCGGSLISESYVLTAAHCRKHTKERPFVRLGGLNVRNPNDGIDVNVAQFIKHEFYEKDSKQNDIMLLKLDQEVPFSPRIRPVCLSQISTVTDKKALATGWGATEYAGSNSDDLLKVGLDILNINLCKTAFEDYEDVVINNNQLCSGILEGNKDTCQGDSGGPLQIVTKDNKCVYEILGITSFSTATCGSKNSPSVYTKVSAYLDWIEARVWPNQ